MYSPAPRSKFFFYLLVYSLAFLQPACAQEAQKKQELQKTQAQLEKQRKQNEKIAENLDRLETEMGTLTQEITNVAAYLQNSEQSFYKLEQQLDKLQAAHAKQESKLKARTAQLSKLIATLIRMSHVPKESALLMPANFTTKMMASRAVSLTSEQLKAEMDDLTIELGELRHLEQQVKAEQGKIRSGKEKLQARRLDLQGIIEKRKTLMQSLHTEQKAKQKTIDALADKANNLQSLLASLEAKRKEEIAKQVAGIGVPVLKPSTPKTSGTQNARTGYAPKSTDVKISRGNMKLPVAGSITGKYGQSRGRNDTLKGLEISTPSGAQVITPAGGEVLYTGKFLDYGQMVIVRHSNQYHTLLAGFERIDCMPGQSLLAGEPIGVMGNSPTSKRLYMELRQSGKPVDPLPWLSGSAAQMARQ